MKTKSIESMRAELDRLMAAERGHSCHAAAFPRGVGMVGKNRRSRDRSIDASVKRSVRIAKLSAELEYAERQISRLPVLRIRLVETDAIIANGVLKGQKMTREQIRMARQVRADISKSISYAERLIAA